METTEHTVGAGGIVRREQPRWIARGKRPRTWLYVALAGLVLTGCDVALGAYRGWDDPVVVGLGAAGVATAAIGALTALTLAAFAGDPSPSSVVQRGTAILAVWLVVAAVAAGAVTYAATSGLPFGDSRRAPNASVASPAQTTSVPAVSDVPGADQRLTLHGNLTIDGKPLDAQFLGARVIDNGLLAACQFAIPLVKGGRYEIIVMADAESPGCGTPGAQVVLWTSVGDGIIYARETFTWPASARASTNFDATFSSADPNGAGGVATEFKGHIVRPDGTLAGGGSVVEAYVGDTLCGTATVHRNDPDAWFTLLVAGPDVPGCAKGGTITFEADGAQVPETELNDLSGGRAGRELRLTIP